MRILILGAGGIGGYFGGRLLEAGCDVTFLLRSRRAAQIDATGLVIRSRFGDVTLPHPPHVSTTGIAAHFDLILLGCKAFDLDSAMESIAPAVGPATAILPLLNGMRHIERLTARFGEDRVLGGHCMISAAVDANGAVIHLNDVHLLVFGERSGAPSERVAAIDRELSRAVFDIRASEEILQEMWEKWVFIASLGGINCLMRAPVGDIVAAGASDLALALFDEACGIARKNGHPPREPAVNRAHSVLTDPASLLSASLLKDLEGGGPTEAEHIVGDLLARGGGTAGIVGTAGNSDTAGTADAESPGSLLRIAHAHLRAYEIRRARGAAPR